MPIESAADRAIFTAAADFGLVATYTSISGGASRSISGIFDAAYVDVSIGLEQGFGSVGPRILVATADLTAGGREGDIWVINSLTYKTTMSEPDGTGMSNVKLEKQ